MTAVQTDRAFGNVVEARRHGQNRGFTAARVADQRDKLASVQFEVKVLNHSEWTFGRWIDFVQLREVEEVLVDNALLRISHRLRCAVDRGDIRQDFRAFDLRFDAHIHQIFGHIRAQLFKAVVVVHLHAVTWTRDRDFEFFAQSAIGAQRNDAVGQNDGLIHIVGDQHTGFLVTLPDRLNLIGQIGAGEGVKRGQWLVQ